MHSVSPERQPAPVSGCSEGTRRLPCAGGTAYGKSGNQTWLILPLCVSCGAQAQSQCGLLGGGQRNDLSKWRVHGDTAQEWARESGFGARGNEVVSRKRNKVTEEQILFPIEKKASFTLQLDQHYIIEEE